MAATSLVGAYALMRVATVASNARRTGMDARDLLLLLVADIIAMALYAGGLFGGEVQWGASRLRVRPGGKIDPITGPELPVSPDVTRSSEA